MIAIKAENISKQYRLGEVGTGSLSHDINRFWHIIRGKEDPYLKIGETNDRTSKGNSNYVWSLKDINFEINQGDAVGIIGRNGAGKSTLLKLLSKITKPTTGKIYTKGRIASLLEVGTGFNPEMTGRENIYLNGAILGMTRKEITRKFDEIVDFSGVERYIDTPVKRYSSGMYVRLAFAVAAHLESEILIVDEVLAVGDAEFQKKCLGKMGNVTKGEGRTVLFVSHDMRAIANLCNNCIYLKNGYVDMIGDTVGVMNHYMVSNHKDNISSLDSFEIDNSKVFIKHPSFVQDNKPANILYQGKITEFNFNISNKSNEDLDLIFNIEIKNAMGEPITFFGNEFQNYSICIPKGKNESISASLGEICLKQGDYYISLFYRIPKSNSSIYREEAMKIEVKEGNFLYFTEKERLWKAFSTISHHGYLPLQLKSINIYDA